MAKKEINIGIDVCKRLLEVAAHESSVVVTASIDGIVAGISIAHIVGVERRRVPVGT